jgi:hypothetical protein
MRRANRSRRQRHGIFIINMLMTIGLLAAFVVVADRVFRLSLITVNRATAGQEDALRLERALDALRADVWTSSKLQPAAGGASLTITPDTGPTIDWRTDDADLVRTRGNDQRRWPGAALTFRTENGVLVASRKTGDVAVIRRAGGAQ